jgi:hypothetical protein
MQNSHNLFRTVARWRLVPEIKIFGTKTPGNEINELRVP